MPSYKKIEKFWRKLIRQEIARAEYGLACGKRNWKDVIRDPVLVSRDKLPSVAHE